VSWGLTTEIITTIETDQAENLIEQVKDTGEAVVLNNIEYKTSIPSGNRAINIQSIIIVPIKSQSDLIGIISIVNKEMDEEFDSNDKLSLEIIGNFAGVAVKNAELHQEALARQKLEHELQLAEHVQSTLMPEKRIEYDKLSVYAYYDVAGQVGGDFYDIIDLGQGRYLVVVADVSNKGVPAALIMTSVRSYVRVISENMSSLCELASRVNIHLSRDIEKLGSMFVTMFFGLIDTNENKLYSVNAGHPPGVIINKGKFEKLKTGGTFIGQFPQLTFTQKESPIEAGDRLIVYTDGIFECVNSSGEMLGMEKAFNFFKKHQNASWDEFALDLRNLMIEYSFDQGRVDDTTLLMIEIK
jgi:sigma-B regulation protein RsbU (phosphoserine phosphatase)